MKHHASSPGVAFVIRSLCFVPHSDRRHGFMVDRLELKKQGQVVSDAAERTSSLQLVRAVLYRAEQPVAIGSLGTKELLAMRGAYRNAPEAFGSSCAVCSLSVVAKIGESSAVDLQASIDDIRILSHLELGTMGGPLDAMIRSKIRSLSESWQLARRDDMPPAESGSVEAWLQSIYASAVGATADASELPIDEAERSVLHDLNHAAAADEGALDSPSPAVQLSLASCPKLVLVAQAAAWRRWCGSSNSGLLSSGWRSSLCCRRMEPRTRWSCCTSSSAATATGRRRHCRHG